MSNKFKFPKLPMSKEEVQDYRIKQFEDMWNANDKAVRNYNRKLIFYEIINDITATITFIVCIPVMPILVIINAIKDS